MNPFRRIVAREIGLYFAALALLAQALMGVVHAAHAFAPADPTICAADHDPMPAHAPAQTCPLCQLPSFAGPVPPALELAAPIAWIAAAYPTPGAAIRAAAFDARPPARGPPASV
jgi:hypothetical protein